MQTDPERTRTSTERFTDISVCAGSLVGMLAILVLFTGQLFGQQTGDAPPVIVRPGAPGQSTKVLPSNTTAKLPPTSQKDIEFMQGMIMHHTQAVEMTALIDSRTKNKEVRLLGARISQSQTDEINFMRRWLSVRGEPLEMQMSGHSHGGSQMLMPGMLSSRQMNALKAAKDAAFDKLLLTGMIQHHIGALVMVKELFDSAGSGQDAELFNFTTDVDTGQRAEIRIMRTLLGEKK